MSTLNHGVDTIPPAMHAEPASPAPGTARRSPRIIALPPLVFAASLLAGIAIDAVAAAPFTPGGHSALRLAPGLFFLCLGGLLARWAHKNFLRRGTNALPWRPTNTLVTDGPYRFTRNPMYLAMAIASLGIAIAAGSFYALVLLVPAILLVDRHAIGREEAFLTQKFGEDYLAYKRSVRRWI